MANHSTRRQHEEYDHYTGPTLAAFGVLFALLGVIVILMIG